MKFFTLPANADYTIGIAPRSTRVEVVHNGTFGSGTITFATLDPRGPTIQALADPAPVTVDGNTSIFLGRGQTLIFRLTGATTPSIAVGIAGDYFEFSDTMQPFR